MVSPGQELQATVSWPGKGIDSGFVTWPSAHAGGAELADISADAPTQPLVVPDRDPGPFAVLAVVSAPDGTTDFARVALELVDAAPYLELRADPPSLTLRGTLPGGVSIFGRRDADHWSELDASPRLQFSSSDPGVVAIDASRGFQAVAPGQATVTATWDGTQSVQIPVDVVDVATTSTTLFTTTTSTSVAATTTSTSIATGSTTSTTLPTSPGCASLTGFAGVQCVCDEGLTLPQCAGDTVLGRVSALFRKACDAMTRASTVFTGNKKKKVKALLHAANGSLGRSLATLHKAVKRRAISAPCGAAVSQTVADVRGRARRVASGS